MDASLDTAPQAKRARVAVGEQLQQQAARQQQAIDSQLVEQLLGRKRQDDNSAALNAASGDVNFSGIYARHQQNLSLPTQTRAPGGAGANGGHQQVQQQQAAGGLRTFADVTTRQVVHEEASRNDSLDIKRAVLLQHRSSSMLHDQAASQQQNQQQQAGNGASALASGTHDLTFTTLPMDWSLKRSLAISSHQRFECYDNAMQATGSKRWSAVRAAACSNLDQCLSLEERMHACLVSWRHPEAPLDATTLSALRATAHNSSSLLAQRLASWRGALHALYAGFRSGECHTFYVHIMSGRNSTVVLFCSTGVRGCQEPSVMVSQTTRALRGRMLAAGVPFTTPLAEAGAAAAAAQSAAAQRLAADNSDDDNGELAAGAGSAAAHIPDNSRQSMALLRGPRAVHGMYDFLLHDTGYTFGPLAGAGGAQAGAGGGAGAGGSAGAAPWAPFSDQPQQWDLPLLVAPVPFEGGTVWRPCIKVAGPLPPWTTHRLINVLAEQHTPGFAAWMDPEPISLTLNSSPPDAVAGQAGAHAGSGRRAGAGGLSLLHGGGCGALTAEEAQAWVAAPTALGGRPIKGVQCGSSSGTFVVRV